MAKKQILSLVAASLVAAAFVGCGSSSSNTPLTVTVSDAYVYGATVTKGGKAFDTVNGAEYTWNDMPEGELASTGGANDLNGNGMADAQDPKAVDMKAPAGYKNINPLTTLEASGTTLDAINAKYGIALETTDIDVTKADLDVYKAAAVAALTIAAGHQTTPSTPSSEQTDDANATEDGNVTENTTPSVAPSRPAIAFSRATLPGRPGGSVPSTDGNTTDGNTTDGNTTTGGGAVTVDIAAATAAINAATDKTGVDAAVRAKMVELMGTYEAPVNETEDVNETDSEDNVTTGGTGTECLPGEECMDAEDNVTNNDDNVTGNDDNATTTSGAQSTPARP